MVLLFKSDDRFPIEGLKYLRDREERNEARRARGAEEWEERGEIGALTLYKSALRNLLQISPRSSRHQVSAVSYSAPNTVWCWEWGLWNSGKERGRDWNRNPNYAHSSKSLPNLPCLHGIGGFVFHPKNTWVLEMGHSAEKKRVGRVGRMGGSGRVGMDWGLNPI